MSAIKKLFKPYRVVAPYILKGSQTVKYPDERLVFAPRFRGRHVLHLDKCIHCGTCSRICPCNSIELVPVEGREGNYPKINYGTCSLCGYCVDFCPTKALEHTDIVEYSTRNRRDLMYPPERLAKVPSVEELVPRLKRRIKPVIRKGAMRYVEVKEE